MKFLLIALAIACAIIIAFLGLYAPASGYAREWAVIAEGVIAVATLIVLANGKLPGGPLGDF